MLQRLFTWLIVVACALAPSLSALEVHGVTASADCGCGQHDCCSRNDCGTPAPASSSARTTPPVAAVVDKRRDAAKPTARLALYFVRFAYIWAGQSRTSIRSSAVAVCGPSVSGVGLFAAHCRLLI